MQLDCFWLCFWCHMTQKRIFMAIYRSQECWICHRSIVFENVFDFRNSQRSKSQHKVEKSRAFLDAKKTTHWNELKNVADDKTPSFSWFSSLKCFFYLTIVKLQTFFFRRSFSCMFFHTSFEFYFYFSLSSLHLQVFILSKLARFSHSHERS